jgi:hypothetical protein
MPERANLFSYALAGFLVVVLGLATCFRRFRAVAIVVVGLVAFSLTGGVLFLAYWSRTRQGAEILLAPAIVGAPFAIVAWVLFASLRSVAKAAQAETERPSHPDSSEKASLASSRTVG